MESHSGKRIGHFRWILASGKCAKWRRGWDLNPRYGFPYARFRGEYFQPLSHLSAVISIVADGLLSQQRAAMSRFHAGLLGSIAMDSGTTNAAPQKRIGARRCTPERAR